MLLNLLASFPLTDSEVTFIKFLGYLLPLLWAWYLGKEIFLGHKPDPAIAALMSSQMELTKAVTTATAEGTFTKARIEELRQMQIRDTDAIFKRLDDMQASFIDALREHDSKLGKLEGASKK
jgi:hypothetical protein